MIAIRSFGSTSELGEIVKLVMLPTRRVVASVLLLCERTMRQMSLIQCQQVFLQLMSTFYLPHQAQELEKGGKTMDEYQEEQTGTFCPLTGGSSSALLLEL